MSRKRPDHRPPVAAHLAGKILGTDLTKTWQARADEIEREARQSVFRQSGKTPEEEDLSSKRALVIALIAALAFGCYLMGRFVIGPFIEALL